MWESVEVAMLSGTGGGVFYLSFFLLFAMDKEKKWKYKLVYPFLLYFLLVMNPLMINYFWNVVMSSLVHRIAICLPIPFVIAYVVSDFWSKTTKRETIVAGIAVVILMLLCYDSRNVTFMVAENLYGIPQDTVEVSDLVLEEEEAPLLLVSQTDVDFFRQYSSKVHLLYGEDVTAGKMGGAKVIPSEYYELAGLMDAAVVNIDKIGTYADAYDVDYIVINQDEYPKIELVEKRQYDYYTTVGRYILYKHI